MRLVIGGTCPTNRVALSFARLLRRRGRRQQKKSSQSWRNTPEAAIDRFCCHAPIPRSCFFGVIQLSYTRVIAAAGAMTEMDIGDGAPGRATISGAADRAGYGAVARSLHWLIVALAVIIVLLIPLPRCRHRLDARKPGALI
jgi:hypothetical protein